MEKGKYAHTDVYVYHVFINKDVLLLTDKRLSYLERNDLFGGWRVSIYYYLLINYPLFVVFLKRNSDISMLLSYFQVDWSHTWNEFSESARVVEKGVQIFIKDINKRKKLSGLFGSADQSKILLITDYNIKQVRIINRLYNFVKVFSISIIIFNVYFYHLIICYLSHSYCVVKYRSKLINPECNSYAQM